MNDDPTSGYVWRCPVCLAEKPENQKRDAHWAFDMNLQRWIHSSWIDHDNEGLDQTAVICNFVPKLRELTDEEKAEMWKEIRASRDFTDEFPSAD